MQPSLSTDDLPEIDESQHTEVEFDVELPAEPGQEPNSLFVSGKSPEPSNGVAYPSVAIQNPEPPSSYLAGAYEAIESSQADQSSSAPVPSRAEPEPSQYVPDPADTTATTEGTTAITFAPTTPSELSRSLPTNLGGSAKIVPDSQTFDASASYVASPEIVTSSSGSEVQSNGVVYSQPPEEVRSTIEAVKEPFLTVSEGQAQGPAPSSPNPETGDSEQFEIPVLQAGISHVVSSDSSDSHTQARDFAPLPSHKDGPPIVEADPPNTGSERKHTSSGVPQSGQQELQGQIEKDASKVQQSQQGSSEQPPSNANTGSHSEPGISQQSSGHINSPVVIDLVSATQQQQSQYRSFDPTPDQRIVENGPEETAAPRGLTSSAWFNSISPFHTQIRQYQNRAGVQDSSPTHFHQRQSQPLGAVPSQYTQLSTITPRASSLPVVFSPVRSIESIPYPPVQSIEADPVGSVDQHRSGPSTPKSSQTMDANQTPSSGETTLLEKLNAATARNRRVRNSEGIAASSPARPMAVAKPPVPVDALSNHAPLNAARLASPLLLANDRARSPSAVPAIEPLPIITQAEMNTSARYETLLPQAQDEDSNQMARKGSLVAGTAPKADSREADVVHTIPIGMTGHQRDQYQNLVWYCRDTISEYLRTDKPDLKTEDKALRLLQRASNVAMHPDLDDTQTLTQYDVEPSQQADWDTKCSAKFRFLADLLKQMRGVKVHVALIYPPGRVLHLLRTFLEGIGLAPAEDEVEVDKTRQFGSAPRVTLLSSDEEYDQTNDPADIVLAMHPSVSQKTASLDKLRKHSNHWSPLVTLIVPYTIEHLQFSMASNLSEAAKTRALVSGIYQLRSNAGKLEDGQLPLAQAAELVAKYLKKEPCDWPPHPIEILDDLDSQTEAEIEVPETNGISADLATGSKRPFQIDDSDNVEHEASKRARIELSGVEEIEATHVSDSVGETSLSNALGESADVVNAPSDTTGKRLQELLLEVESRVREGDQALANLQYRHEEQRNELVQMTAQRDAAIETAQAAVQRMAEQQNLRSRVKELEQQLKEANERLLDHSVPAIAEFAALKIATEDALKDKDKAVKSYERATNDNAYVRELYQESSSRAQQLAAQNTELENSLAVAQNRVTGEQTKLRQMGYDSYTKKLQKDNRQLRDMVKDRDTGIRFRDEEIAKLKEASRGRMGTRGTSVPRSPRLGSPMKMGSRSRQGSPVPGELRGRSSLLHPLRNV